MPDKTSAAVTGAVAVVVVVTVVFAAVVLAVRLELSLLEFCELEDLRTAVSEERLLLLDFGFERLVFRQPPPTGTLRSTPPLVQYRRQFLQK